MSAELPNYEDLSKMVQTMQTEINTYRNELSQFTASATKKAGMDDEDKSKHDAAFKAAMDDHDKSMKESTAAAEKVATAFKTAAMEDDPDKKEAAQKIAMDMKDDHDNKTAKKANMDNEKKEAADTEKEKMADAKIASLENKHSEPMKIKIMHATKTYNPQRVEVMQKFLKNASLEQVEEKYNDMAGMMSVLGIQGGSGEAAPSASQQPAFVPFQASAATTMGTGITVAGKVDIKNASIADTENIDWNLIDTKDIQGLDA